jgi:hypothetical protein
MVAKTSCCPGDAGSQVTLPKRSRTCLPRSAQTRVVMIHVGEEIIAEKKRRFRVLDIVRFDDENEVAIRPTATGRGGVPHAPPRREAPGRMLRRGGRSRRAGRRSDGGIGPRG